MEWLRFEPGTKVWQAQTTPLSYGAPLHSSLQRFMQCFLSKQVGDCFITIVAWLEYFSIQVFQPFPIPLSLNLCRYTYSSHQCLELQASFNVHTILHDQENIFMLRKVIREVIQRHSFTVAISCPFFVGWVKRQRSTPQESRNQTTALITNPLKKIIDKHY